MATSTRITTTQDIKHLGSILSVWAHPDDESFLAAGILHTAVKSGQPVACVTATKGEAGSSADEKRWPRAHMGEIRKQELKHALKILGIKTHFWLDYPDGGCAAIDPKLAVAKLVAIIKQVQPDTILTFGPEGLTGHSDHAAVSRWVGVAVASLGLPIVVYHAVCTPEQYETHLKAIDKKMNLFFNIDKPPLVAAMRCDIQYKLPPAICHCKNRALAVQHSQNQVLTDSFSREYLEDAFGTEAFIKAPTREV
jgi:LmbE family N-acetylglucosaminyl deacetylase